VCHFPDASDGPGASTPAGRTSPVTQQDRVAGRPSPTPRPEAGSRPDLRPASERRIARALRLAPHLSWLTPPVALVAGRPWWALGLIVLCGAFECAWDSYARRRRGHARARYRAEDVRQLADRVRDGWSTVTAFAGLAYTYWRPSFYPFEGADCLAAKLDRFQHHMRRLGERPWPPHLIEIEPHPLGLVLTVARTHGQTVEDYRRAAPRLASALAALRVDVQPGHGADVVQLIVVLREPLTDSIPMPPLGTYRGRGVVELGVREDGQPWVMRLTDSSGVLIGGVPGSGKSGVLAALFAGLAGAPGVEIAGIDLKAAWNSARGRRACSPSPRPSRRPSPSSKKASNSSSTGTSSCGRRAPGTSPNSPPPRPYA
jgi:hypothetical protein